MSMKHEFKTPRFDRLTIMTQIILSLIEDKRLKGLPDIRSTKQFLADFISALVELNLSDSEIDDILKCGIENIKEIREEHGEFE